MPRVSLLAPLPALAAAVALLLFLPACGGRTAGESTDAGPSSEAGPSSDADVTSDAHAATDAPPPSDASPTSDAGTGTTCVDIDAAAFSTTCAADTDCINVFTGQLCDGYDCICGGTAISASAQAQYDAIFSTVTEGPGPFCGCPYLGSPRCIQNTCVYCPNPALNGTLPPGCPDGG